MSTFKGFHCTVIAISAGREALEAFRKMYSTGLHVMTAGADGQKCYLDTYMGFKLHTMRYIIDNCATDRSDISSGGCRSKVKGVPLAWLIAPGRELPW